jgi:multiple sugar transport system permease protein
MTPQFEPVKPSGKHMSRMDKVIAIWEKAKTPINYVILVSWALICLAPLYFTLVFSLKPVANAYTPPLFLPIPFTLDNFTEVVTAMPIFPRWVMNSLIISLGLTILRVLFCSMAGYAFARMEFPFKRFLFNAMLFSMMIPGQVTLIPMFLVVGPGIFRGGLKIGDITIPTGFGLLDSLGGVMLPLIVSAFGIFMMTQFFKSFPKELEEAAEMDGLGKFGTFFKIVLPLSRTQLLTLALFTFQGEWNAFMWPLVILRSPDNFTLPLGLNFFRNEYYTLISKVLAGSLFNTIPIIILFFVFQKYFIQSIANTGSKEG